MKRALTLALICFGMASVAFAQWQKFGPATTPSPYAETPDGTTNAPTSATLNVPPAAADTTPLPTSTTADNTPVAPLIPTASAPSDRTTGTPDAQGAVEMPLDTESFDARIHRRLDDYGQRHQQRGRVMASYDRASNGDPGLGRFADPRKVQVELNDELDREQTSEELSGDYAEQAHDVQVKAKALEDFVAKRRRSLDDLNKHSEATHRQDLEVALANLARQPLSPETMAQMREIDRRLSEADRNEKDLPGQMSQTQQEAADAAEELSKLEALRVSYEKEAKAFTADALSARQNRMRLAGRLEYYVVRSQAEDELEQGRKAIDAAQHLSASPEVESLLRGSGSSTKSDAVLQQLRDCIRDSGDVKNCRAIVHQE